MKKTPKQAKSKRQLRRKRHIRKTISGCAKRPRVSIRRSINNLYAQMIDDETGATLVGLGTLSKDVRGELGSSGGGNVKAAEILGVKMAEKAKAAGIDEVVFDRNGYRYHGRVKAFADALRGHGLKF